MEINNKDAFEQYLIVRGEMKNEYPYMNNEYIYIKTLMMLSYLYLGTKDIDASKLCETMLEIEKEIKKQKIQ